ncbi:ATP-binding cassette domain-containing protein [Lactobacillus rizhaonensis]|uniref:ATP-binding cassette domain-containing protein n=1 Tax=Lactobacillus rizhaonensis TaxID=3082863 RepID=UPI0030C6FCC8
MKSNSINVEGARTNNLKNISVEFPKNKITVITGLSGAGKSSLALSTIAAAAQRQVNKTYSAYIQQLLPHFKEPEVDKIKNLPFTVVVDQKGIGNNCRSTLGTYSDIYAALRLLYSRLAKPFIGYSMNYSFNNPAGMCPRCQGLGEVREIIPENLLDITRSLNDGAIKFPTFQPGGWRLTRYTESGYFNNDLPLREWSQEKISLLLNGKKQVPPNPTSKWHRNAKYIGIIPRITETFLNKNSSQYQKEMDRIIKVVTCPVCHGQRLNQKALTAKINNKNIAECSMMSLVDLKQWLNNINDAKTKVILEEIEVKLTNLINAGLGYLNLNRTTASLSGGEAQRVKLANYLNSDLTDLLYIFDEPSVGLHPYDLQNINNIFKQLRDKGNTVIIVDHDPQVIAISDKIVNLGELAGNKGGYVTFSGNFADLIQSNKLTGKSLRHKGKLKSKQKSFKEFYYINNASLNNLHNVKTKIPQQSLTAITGVAGSGKSSLVRLIKKRYPEAAILDQHEIHGSNRSNVLTYLNVFEQLRQYFAQATKQSSGLFSFNSLGACPVCKGKGVLKLDLAYIGESVTTCDSCHGQRYSQKALEPKVCGMNIAEAMALSPTEFAAKFPILKSAMAILKEVGLDYIKLNQSLDTFSGGELQRLKLAKFLLGQSSKILVLDEPTSGLHEYNVQDFINLLQNLIFKYGITIIVIEHNLRLIGQADWVVDIGPNAGNKGGKIMFAGSPEELVKQKTLTAVALRDYFGI